MGSLSGEVRTEVLCGHICDLEAENAKLRELLAGDETQRRIAAIGEGTVPTYHGTETVDEARLVVENAKLRKLAQRMWRLERFGCYGCRQECDAESCYASDCREAVEIEQEMRELEIEVPQ